jgi:hypothetical protein
MTNFIHENSEPITPLYALLSHIAELLIDLPEESDSIAGLIREHLEEARWYLLASMPQEYHLTLKMAERLVPEIHDKDLRARIGAFLKSQHAGSTHIH